MIKNQQQIILNKLLALICSVFDAYSSVFFKLENDFYYPKAYFSLGNNVNPKAKIKSNSGLIGWINQHQKPLRLNKFDKEEKCLGYYQGKEENKIKAFMGCNLPHNQGVLCVDSKKNYSFSEKDLKILTQFAELIVILDRAETENYLFSRQIIYYKHLSIILNMINQGMKWNTFLPKLLTIVAESTGFEYSLFFVRNETGTHFSLEGSNKSLQLAASYPISLGVIGWIFNNGKDIFQTSNVEKQLPLLGKEELQFKNFACLPLIINKKVRAVLVIASKDDKEFDPELKNYLTLLKHYLSLFFENLYFKNKTLRGES